MRYFKMMKKIAVVLVVMMLTACQETMDERCMREAKEYTKKHCPAFVSDGVTIDSLVYVPQTRTLTYYYTLEGAIDDAKALKEHDFKGILLKELRNTASMKIYKDAGYNFRYVYYSTKKSGAKLFEATFREKDYR